MRVPLVDVAHSRLVEAIMNGSMPPGEQLKVLHLAGQLNISPTPVREALARLEGQGLVVRLPMRGYTVAEPLSPDEIEQLMSARAAVESRIAEAAAGGDRAVETGHLLLENVASSRAAPLGPRFEEYREYLDLSARFHQVLAENGGNRFLRAALDALPVHVQRFRLFGDVGVTDADVSLDEHERIARAVAAGDAREAGRAMADHIRGVGERSLATSAPSR